jgi:uncharacterized membrane protein YqjE
MEHTNEHTIHEEHNSHESHGDHGHGSNETSKEELRLSGDDIVAFVRKIFKAGNSRQVVWRDEDNKKIVKVNLILMTILTFLLPIFALIAIIILILMNHSISIEKNKVV